MILRFDPTGLCCHCNIFFGKSTIKFSTFLLAPSLCYLNSYIGSSQEALYRFQLLLF